MADQRTPQVGEVWTNSVYPTHTRRVMAVAEDVVLFAFNADGRTGVLHDPVQRFVATSTPPKPAMPAKVPAEVFVRVAESGRSGGIGRPYRPTDRLDGYDGTVRYVLDPDSYEVS